MARRSIFITWVLLAACALMLSSCGEASSSRPSLQLTDEGLLVDVGSCVEGKIKLRGKFGPSAVWVRGADGDDCVVEYGYTMELPEHPRWEGEPKLTCHVPSSEGEILLPKERATGIKAEPILQWCQDTFKPWAS